MKINIEVDISPEEVRRLYGLPDLSSVHKTLSNTISESLHQCDEKTLNGLLSPAISKGMNSLESYQKLLSSLFEKSNDQQTKPDSNEH